MKHTTLLVAGLAVLAPSIARADTFMELGGGLVLPVSDDDYTDAVEPSVGLAARIGGGGKIGGMFSVEWAPLDADNDVPFTTFSYNRFRLLGHVVVHHRLSPKAELAGRFGAGIDIVHSKAEVDIGQLHSEGSDSDVGLALEFAGGVWFGVGSGSTQVGVELAMPIGIHNSDPDTVDADHQRFDYTAFDIEILGGVRLRL